MWTPSVRGVRKTRHGPALAARTATVSPYRDIRWKATATTTWVVNGLAVAPPDKVSHGMDTKVLAYPAYAFMSGRGGGHGVPQPEVVFGKPC
jgi:hypothetical protein